MEQSKTRRAEFGFYEKRLCFLLFLSAIPNPYPFFQTLITHYTPKHHCDIRNLVGNVTAEANEVGIDTGNWSDYLLNFTIPWETNDLGIKHRSSCTRYNITSVYVENRILEFAGNRSSVIPCSSVYFDSNAISATTEFGFVCEKAWQKPLMTSVIMFGNLFGGVIGGILSDRYGRKNVFLAFTALQYVTALATSFANSITVYAIMMFLTGFSSLINFMAAVLIGAEFVPPRLRIFTYFCIELGYCFGCITVAPLMYFFTDWRWFFRFIGLTGLLYTPFIWLIDETPPWLLAAGKVKEAERVLRKVAKTNKQAARTIEELQETMELKSAQKSGVWRNCKNVVSSPTLLSRIIIMCFSWAIVTATYYVIALNVNSLSGDRILNTLYSGLAETAATIVFVLMVRFQGRRKTYIGCMSATAISVAIAPLLTLWTDWVVTFVAMFSRFGATVAFNVIYVFTGELFPTKTRHSLFGICSASARIGGLVAPFLIYAGEDGNTLRPSLAISAFILLSVASYVFLPETGKQKLPQTIQEAENMKGGVKPRCCREGSLNDTTENEATAFEALNA